MVMRDHYLGEEYSNQFFFYGITIGWNNYRPKPFPAPDWGATLGKLMAVPRINRLTYYIYKPFFENDAYTLYIKWTKGIQFTKQ